MAGGGIEPNGREELDLPQKMERLKQWCAAYPAAGQSNPRGPETGSDMDDRVLRDGSFYQDAYRARCAARKSASVGVAYFDYGFRCVRGD